MSTVDFKAVGDHAKELSGYASDNNLWESVETLKSIASAGKPKYSTDRVEALQLRCVAFNLQRMAVEFETVADRLIAMVGEGTAAPAAATDDEPPAKTVEEKRDDYSRGAADAAQVTTDSGGLFLGMPTSWRDKLQTATARAPSWIDKLLSKR